MTQANVLSRWWDLSKCKDMDVERFVMSRHNKGRMLIEALALCDVCPVRAECRDDMLAVAPGGPAAIIAGGWRWYRDGRARPHRDDILQARELIEAAKIKRQYSVVART